MTELHHLTATDAIGLFRSRELSPVELLDAVVARTEKVDGRVNAVTEQLLDSAYESAREAERRYAGSGPAPRPLEGVPLALKEEHPIAGHTIEEGSLITQGEIAELSHPVVERVQAAGAVVHSRVTTPEFCCAPFTNSKLWGVTRNPWNLELTPGGSSGGSGAALAAGETILATGSDIGGSIRIPSSFCGVVGFKAPFGRVPGLPPYNSDTYCADGPMGRSVADVAMLQNVLAGPHPHDQASLRPVYVLPTDPAPAAGLKVALCVHLGDFPVDPVVAANTRAAADALRSMGVTVDEVTLPWSRERIAEIAWAHFGGIMGAEIGSLVEEYGEHLMPYTHRFAERALAGGGFAAGLVGEVELYRPLGELLESYDALLCPTVPVQGVEADAIGDELLDIDGTPSTFVDSMLTLPFNVIGRVPVLAVPSGIAPNGVPTGVQLVGRTYDDATVFRLGAALESALALWTRPDWWPAL